MSVEPSLYDVDYSGWRCGGCNEELAPDGECLSCSAAHVDHVEDAYVDPYELMDELDLGKAVRGTLGYSVFLHDIYGGRFK